MGKIIKLTEGDLINLIKRVLAEETEMTEACWKGYTKKGMKTMFGKRYPNCVKNESEEIEETSKNKILYEVQKGFSNIFYRFKNFFIIVRGPCFP